MTSQEGIATTLLRLGVIQKERTRIFSSDTRDKKGLSAFQDEVRKVIFRDFRKQPKSLMTTPGRDFEDHADKPFAIAST